MINKQTAPIIAGLAPAIATTAPALLFIGGLVALAAWLFSDNDEKKPEKPPENATVSRPPLTIPPNSGGNSAQKHCIPANSAGKTTVPQSQTAFPVNSVPTVPIIPVLPPPVIPAVKNTPEIPQQSPKKTITRNIMAGIFDNGMRKLDRKAAVTALKALGFGKSAAYEAFEINGRFAPWLQFAPDGIIAWKG